MKLTEKELNRLVNESVRRVLIENQEDESFFDNLKSGFKNFKNGYYSQKTLDSDSKNDYSKNARISPNEAPSDDAYENVRKMYELADYYRTKSNELVKKAKEIAKHHGVNVQRKPHRKTEIGYDVTGSYGGSRLGRGSANNSRLPRSKFDVNTPGNSWSKSGNDK